MNKENKEQEKDMKKSWLGNMSQFEKIFWATILLFMTIFIVVNLIAINKTDKKYTTFDLKDKNKPLISEFVSQYLPTDKAGENLSLAQNKINENINSDISTINSSIDKEIDELFYSVENNIDGFLDYHYSIKGEYSELGAMAFGNIEELIEEELFGADFTQKLQAKSSNINSQYKDITQKHYKMLKAEAFNGVNTDINNESLNKLYRDIEINQMTQEGKVGLLVAARFGPKLVAMISAKLAGKATVKMAGKTAVKVGAKSATASTAALAGLACGPFAWVCSPVLATGAWFATDAIIISGDELLNREDFKKQILSDIRYSKEELKNSYKQMYNDSFLQFSKNIQEKMENTPLIEEKKVRRTIIDKHFNGFKTKEEAIQNAKVKKENNRTIIIDDRGNNFDYGGSY